MTEPCVPCFWLTWPASRGYPVSRPWSEAWVVTFMLDSVHDAVSFQTRRSHRGQPFSTVINLKASRPDPGMTLLSRYYIVQCNCHTHAIMRSSNYFIKLSSCSVPIQLQVAQMLRTYRCYAQILNNMPPQWRSPRSVFE